MGLLTDVDPELIAALGRRLADVNAGIDDITSKVGGKYDSPVEMYANLVVAIPDEMSGPVARDWLCVALARIAHLEKAAAPSVGGVVQ